MRRAFELDTKKNLQRNRHWKRASLTPCKVEEAPNSTLTDPWSHFKLLNFGDVIIIRVHNLKDLLIVPYLEAPFLGLQFFPHVSCVFTLLNNSALLFFLSVSKMQLQHQKRWCQRAHLSVLAALTPERLTSSTLIPGFCGDVRERQLR